MKGDRSTHPMETTLMPIGPAVYSCLNRFASNQERALEICLSVLRSKPERHV